MQHVSFNASDRSYLAIIKKEIHRLALQKGFEPKKLNEIDIVVAELGTNLVKHTANGEILVTILQEGERIALEMISIDNGPGIADPDKMLIDGVSTSHTLGHGLGAIRRLSDTFELYSKKDWGTILLSRIYDKPLPKKEVIPLPFLIRALVVAKPGERVSGDGYYAMTTRGGITKLLVADGLGHGAEAHHAVNEAIAVFKTMEEDSPVELLRQLHASIKKTRGMVATVVIINPLQKTWKICGVGNIATRLTGYQNAKNYLSYNGIIGHNIPTTLNDQELSQNDFQQIVLCSDGIKSRWEYAKHPSIQKYDLIVQAAALYKDFARKTDDMSVIIGRAAS